MLKTPKHSNKDSSDIPTKVKICSRCQAKVQEKNTFCQHCGLHQLPYMGIKLAIVFFCAFCIIGTIVFTSTSEHIKKITNTHHLSTDRHVNYGEQE